MGGLTTINRILNKLNLELFVCNPKEAVAFAKKYFGNKKIMACEIGVWKGQNAKAINQNLKLNKFFLIDSYKVYDEYKHDNCSEILVYAKKKAHRLNRPWEKTNVWIEKYSEKALKEIKEKLDFIYIDGNHEYSYVKKDLENSWKLLRKGGILSGHDINQPDVSRAVMEFIKKNNLMPYFGDRRDWWIIKER